jgi:hypothetical protein
MEGIKPISEALGLQRLWTDFVPHKGTKEENHKKKSTKRV